jgi:hypothetical protein
MPSRPRFIITILWLLTPEPSDGRHDCRRFPNQDPLAEKPFLPHWAKALFWYGIAVALYLFVGNWR